MRPERRCGGRDEISDTRAVLTDADTVATRHTRVAIGHMARALLVGDRDKADARCFEQVERVHISRTHDSKYVGYALRDQRLDERLGRRHSRRAARHAAIYLGFVKFCGLCEKSCCVRTGRHCAPRCLFVEVKTSVQGVAARPRRKS